MKRNEILYNAIISVEEDYVDEAGNYKFKKKNIAALLFTGVAACLIIGITFAVLAIASKQQREREALNDPSMRTGDPGAEATAVPTPAIIGKKIVFGGDEEGPFLGGEEVMRYGKKWILGALADEIKIEENENALFYVVIDFFFVARWKAEELSSYYWERLKEAENTPACQEYLSLINEWWRTVKYPALSDEEKNRYNQNKGYFDYRDYCDFVEEFFEYVENTVSVDRLSEMKTAKDNYEKALYEYCNYEVTPQIADEYRAEIERLMKLGYAIDVSTLNMRQGYVLAYLTKPQIEEFSVNPMYSYWIYFAGKHEFFCFNESMN